MLKLFDHWLNILNFEKYITYFRNLNLSRSDTDDDYYQDTTEQSIASNPSGKTKLFLQQGTLCLKVAKILESRKEQQYFRLICTQFKITWFSELLAMLQT